jgi:hypothetical protein
MKKLIAAIFDWRVNAFQVPVVFIVLGFAGSGWYLMYWQGSSFWKQFALLLLLLVCWRPAEIASARRWDQAKDRLRRGLVVSLDEFVRRYADVLESSDHQGNQYISTGVYRQIDAWLEMANALHLDEAWMVRALAESTFPRLARQYCQALRLHLLWMGPVDNKPQPHREALYRRLEHELAKLAINN